MDEKIINGLKDLGYSGPLLSKNELETALQDGPKSVEYTKLVNFLTNELRTLCNIDEQVNSISSPEDSVSFVMEISSFLKELNCPYSSLIHGHISHRLQSVQDCLLLLDYLLTELMGARILQEKKPDRKIELEIQETEEAASMKKILMTLRFPKPPHNITVNTLFQKLTPSVENAVQKAGPDLVGKPAFSGFLSDKQWETLNALQKDFNNEYKIRREMLLTRLDVTIQSFQWSDKTKGKDDLFEKIYTENRKLLKSEPDVDLSDLLAARDDIAIIEKTSNSSVRKNTHSQINKIIIGQVPDRGGRTSEQAPPPPEMPSWQQRSSGPSGSRGGGQRPNYRGKAQQNTSRDNHQSRNFDNYGQRPNYGGSGFDNSTGKDYHQNRNFDSAGSYGHNNERGNYDNRRNYNSRGNYDNSSGGSRAYDSAGSYEQNSKRVKTFDSFQSNRTTYADQYVQDNQHNQQYRRGGGERRGRYRGEKNY